MKKIKVSELPLWNDIKGLFVMGVNSLNQSVKVSLEFIKEHTDAAVARADKATSDAQAATERADEAKDNVLATIARVIPTALVVAAPESLTLGSAAALPRIAAQLQPEGVMQNLIFIGDNKAVAVDAQGNLRVLAEGVSLVHVIPTCNTALAKSVLIHVHAPYVRLSARNTLRLTSSGAFRFN